MDDIFTALQPVAPLIYCTIFLLVLFLCVVAVARAHYSRDEEDDTNE